MSIDHASLIVLIRIRIEGMSCQHCVRAVFTALTPVEGIISADVAIGRAVDRARRTRDDDDAA